MVRGVEQADSSVADEPFVPEYLSCSYGSCGHEPETVYWSEGKAYYLCDEHWEKIVSPDLKTEKAARAKLGIPMPVFREDQSPPKWERPVARTPAPVHKKEYDCAVPDCCEPPTVMVRNTHLCDKHWKATRSSDTERRWAVRDALGWTDEDMAKANAESAKAKKKAGAVQATRAKDVIIADKKRGPSKRASSSKEERRAAIMDEPKIPDERDKQFDDFAAMIANL